MKSKRTRWSIIALLALAGIAFAASTKTDRKWTVWTGTTSSDTQVEELGLTATALYAVTDDGLDLGTTGLRFADGYFGDDIDAEGDISADGDVAGATGTFSGAVTAGSFTGGVVRTAQEYIASGGGYEGATKGWVTSGTTNIYHYTLPASQTTSTLVLPVSGLHIGDTITAFKIVAQIESAGGAVLLDCDLRKTTTVAAGNTDTLVGRATQVSVAADTAVATAKTGLTEVVAADETFYFLIAGTTAGSTDIDLQGCTYTVTTN